MLKRQSSINQTFKKCTYVLKPATVAEPAVYCNRYTNWHMVLDENNRRVRHYDCFCVKHGGMTAWGIKGEDNGSA